MSFRRFGGLQYAAKHNIVSSNFNTSNNLSVTENVGQPNSYINFLSDISNSLITSGLTGTQALTSLSFTGTGVTGPTGIAGTIGGQGSRCHHEKVRRDPLARSQT